MGKYFKIFQLWIFFPTLIIAQMDNFEFQNITVADGLSHGCISCIHQDGDGFIWIGTEAGLNRYDGYTIKEYLNQPGNKKSISNNFIMSIFEDASDSGKILWIGTNGGGLNKFDIEREEFLSFTYDPVDSCSINCNEVKSICKENENYYWIGTVGGGLNLFNRTSGNFIQFCNDPFDSTSLSNDKVFSVCKDHIGNVWIGTNDGLNKLSINSIEEISQITRSSNFSFKRYYHDENDKNSLPSNTIHSVFEDKNNVLWIGTSHGLRIYDRRSNIFEQYRFSEAHRKIIENKRVYSFYEDNLGELWITTLGAGIFNIYKARDDYSHIFPIKGHKLRLSSANVSSIVKDASGINWAGTYCNGINKIIPKLKNFYHHKYVLGEEANIVSNWIFSIVEGSNGNILIGTQGGILVEFDRQQNRFKRIKFTNNCNITAMHKTESKAIWLSRDDFLTKINSRSEVIENYYMRNLFYKDEDIKRINGVIEDASGILWCLVGTYSDYKLYQLDEKNKRMVPYSVLANEIISDNITNVFNDNMDEIWFGTRGFGLIKRIKAGDPYSGGQNDSFVHYLGNENSISLRGIIITNIIQTLNGFLYIGTDKGLIVFDSEKENFIKWYRNKDGLISEHISYLIEDKHGFIWITTNKGLSRINPSNETIYNFQLDDGLPSVELGGAPICESRDGWIYIGGKDGLVFFHPDSLRYNTHIPQIAITDFQLFYETVSPGNNSPLSKSISKTENIILGHDQNAITFEFAALDFTDPKKNKYAYKMEGVDNDWVHTTAERRFAIYPNLDPGEYQFRVKGSNNDGVWSHEGKSLNIIITPPWWKTDWAYLFYILTILAIITATWRFQFNREKMKHQLKLEHEHAKKLEEIDHLKSNFFANISHEFRTPLTLILGPLEKMLQNSPKHNLAVQYEVMLRNAKKLLTLINQLLDLSKLEAGGMKLKTEPKNIVSFLRVIVLSFTSLAERKQITLKYYSPEESLIVYIDKEKIEKIITNLLSNAFKFTHEGGNIEVSIYYHSTAPSLAPLLNTISNKNGFIEIKISDTGVGIPKEKLSKIFNRFYQIDGSKVREHEGTGIGLSLAKELVELHHGFIYVDSEPGVGTTFSILLPQGKDHLSDDEITTESVFTPKVEKDIIGYLDEEIIPEIIETGISVKRNIFGRTSKQRCPNILIVEDNADIRDYIKQNIASEYKIEEAENGLEGFQKAQRIIPELIISDVMMPIMDGVELCSKLKKNEMTSHIPIILLTARAAIESKLAGLETGADDYITKPFDVRELRVRIKNLIEQRQKLREFFKQKIDIDPKEVTVSSMDEEFLNKAIEIFEKHVADENYSVEKFSKDISLSRVHLNRKLKALTGNSTSEFIRTLRLKRAAQLLSQKSGSVSEIAFEVGFNNLSYFAKSFKKQFGKLPSEFC